MWLITGGAGFVGSHIVRHLAGLGEPVRVVDNLSSGQAEALAECLPQIEFIEGDIRDTKTARAAMRGVRVVLHQAAQASVPRSLEDPAGTYAVNLDGTLNLLQAAVDAGTGRFVLASTSAVYGDEPITPKAETLLPRPISPYASSKLAAEHLCAVFAKCYGLQTLSLRYFNVFGPGQSPNSAYAAIIPTVIERLQSGQRPLIYGDGEQTRDFIFIDDVVRANMLAASATLEPGIVLNVASGRPTSVNQVLHGVADILGVPAEADYQPERAGDIRDSLADIRRAGELLGFTAQVSLADGLAATIAGGLTVSLA